MIDLLPRPESRLIRVLDRINDSFGRALGIAVLALILVQFILVISSAAFSYGSIWLQESRLYLNALIFLGGAGYAMIHDSHVRVDVFFRDADSLTRAWVDLLGSLLFLLPFLFLIWWAGLPYVLDSIRSAEGSVETGGIPFVYVMKAMVLLFAATLSLSAASMIVRSLITIYKDPYAIEDTIGDNGP